MKLNVLLPSGGPSRNSTLIDSPRALSLATVRARRAAARAAARRRAAAAMPLMGGALLLQVLLAVSAGTSPTTSAGLLASAPPTISSVSPTLLPTTGNTTLLVWGRSFATGRLASCRLASATPGTAWTHAGYAGKSDLRFPAKVINDSLLECVPPAVLAPGPGILSVATNCTTVPCVLGNWGQHVPWQSGLPWAEPVQVTYFTLVDATVGRRPYINETVAELLIATHVSLRGTPLEVSAFLPADQAHTERAGSSWKWRIRPQNGSDIVSFPLKGLPPTINTDLRITITAQVGVNFTRWRRFQRAPPLPADSHAVPVVVDHHTKSLNVGGKLFIGLGWYLGLADWNGTEHVKIVPETILELVRTQAALGVNQVLVIESQVRKWSNMELLAFMDGCHEHGVKVIHPMMSFGTGGGGPNAQHYERHWDGSAAAAQWKAQVLANVTLIKDHPALLGYSICDDCCGGSADFIALQSRLYNTIKAADPHHITTGAVQCHNVWLWSDVENSLLQQAGSPPLIPVHANDSQTQLSLDYPVIENYGMILSEPSGGAAKGDAIPGWANPLLAQCTPASIDHSCTNTGLLVDHAGTGEWEGGTTGDGAFRHGAEWEPLCNIYSILADGAFQDIPAAPIDSRTGMWLGVINAGLVNQLAFNLKFATLQPLSGPTGGWRQTIQLPLFGGEVAALAPSLLAPFGSVPSLTVTVLQGVSLRPHGVLRGPVVRAKAWMEPDCPTICAHLAVASFDQDSPAQFSVRIEGGLPGQQGKAANATRLFDASYNATLEADGTLSDWIGAGATHVYEVGCTGPRPAIPMRSGAEPHGLPWAACANRRLQCANGFVHKDGAEPPSPHHAACGVFNGHKNHTLS
jgi:hypothetical protein